MKKKLIIHNGNISIGGQEKMLIEFLNILNPEKYDVLLLIEENNGQRNDYINLIPNWIKYRFLTTEDFMMKIEKSKRSKNILKKLYYSFLLKRKKEIAVKEINKNIDFADIIIDYDMGMIRNLHKINLVGKKIIAWSHAGEGAPLKSKQKRENIEKYDYIVAINEVMKQGYEKSVKNPKIIKLYNFMEVKSIVEKSKENIEDELKNIKYVLSIGSLTENKNHILLIEAFGELKKENKIDEKLIIIGEGKERDNLEKEIKRLNLESEIKLLGQRDNPYKYIEKARLFVLPSKNEGLPLTPIETMILGKMVIATETNGTREILGADSKYGKLVKNNDKEDLKEKLYYYLKNDSEREKYETLGFERAKYFKNDNAIKLIEEFIDKL